MAPADVVVLTDRMEKDGRLRWDAPAGSWAILRFGYTSTGARNGPATAEGPASRPTRWTRPRSSTTSTASRRS